MIGRLLNTAATIQRRSASSTDDHGNPTTSTASSVSTVCYLEQIQQTEVQSSQATSRAEYLCVLPAGTSIDQTDRVVIGSTTYQVEGVPWQAFHARTGEVHHVECTLVEVHG